MYVIDFKDNLGFVAGPSLAGAETAEAQSPHVSRLENGLTVLFMPDRRFPLISMRLYVHAGSAYEESKEFGLSHLLEHMVFKGTNKRPKGEVAEAIESLGGNINAATSFDYTMYLVDLPADEWRVGLDVLKDMAFNPTLDKDELESEKNVVISELKMGEDNPEGRVFKLLQKATFAGTPYAHPIIGYEETLRAITRDDMLAYIKKLYQPQSMLLVVCGNVDQEPLMQAVREEFSALKNDRGITALTPLDLGALPDPSQKIQVESGPWNKVYLGISFPAPNQEDLRGAQLEVFTQLTGGDRTSWLYRKYKYDKRLVDDIGFSNYSMERLGMLYLDVTLEAEKVPAFWAEFTKDLKKLSGLEFDGEAMARAKLNLEDSLYRMKETLPGLATKLGYFQFFSGGEEGEKNYLRALSSVDGQVMRTVASEFMRPEALSLVALVPEGSGLDSDFFRKGLEANWPAPAVGGEAFGRDAPAEAAAGPEVVELAEGSKLILLSDPTLPYISADLMFTGGDALLSPDEQGLASLTASVLTRGTKGKKLTALEDYQADRASALGASSGRQTFTLSLRAPTRFQADLFGLLRETLTAPTFDQAELSRAAQNQVAAIKAKEDRPVPLAFRRIFPFLFGESHPYGYLQLGEPERLLRFKRADVVAFWDKQKREPFVLAVCGDFDRQAIIAEAEALNGALLRQGRRAAPVAVGQVDWSSDKLLTLHLAERKQAHLFWIFPTVSLTDPDSPGLKLMQSILDGQSGLLFRDLRDKDSLGYSVTAFSWQADQAGALIFYIGTEVDKVSEAKAGFLKAVDILKNEELPEAELERGKRMLEGEYYRSGQSLSARSLEAATMGILGRPLDLERRQIDEAKHVTPNDLQRLAQKYFKPDAAYWVEVLP